MDTKQKNAIKDNNEKIIALTSKILSASSKLQRGKVESFLEHVESKKRISINVNAESLLEILDTGVYMNVFELGYGEDAIQKRYDDHTLPYYDKLNSFVSHIKDGKSIKYGALNTGGMGITKFPGFGGGTYCLILSESFTEALKDKIFCLMKFSLDYIKNDGTLKSNMWKEVSTYENVKHLALKKHKADIKTINKTGWPEMISNKRGWLELLIYNKITIADIEELRIEKKLYEYNEHLLQQSNYAMSIYVLSVLEIYRETKNICLKSNITINATNK